MPTVPAGRRVARAAVNALRALLERHDHIVHEVDGQNDFGEDLHVEFTVDGRRTGDLVKAQIKGGRSWRGKGGYRVPVDHHGESWADGNVPVLCIVHDPDTETLYWANATEQLLSARRQRRVLKSIVIDEAKVLDDGTVAAFVVAARHYLSRYRGNQALQARIGEMAGAEFETSDIVLHFVNEHGEDLVFWQRQGEGYATLLHSDLDWEPEFIGPEMLHFDMSLGLRGVDPVPTVGDTILNPGEALWLAACFESTEWARRPRQDQAIPAVRHEVLDAYIAKRVRNRLFREPEALSRSIEVARSDSRNDPAVLAEPGELEADAAVRAEAAAASYDTWDDMSPAARRLATLYLVERVNVGLPSDPIGEQFRIVWRWRRPWGEYGFSARVGRPSTRLTSRREIVAARRLAPGDTVYWLSRHGNERGRRVSETWWSEETPGAVCVLFDNLSLGDTFWPGEEFARTKRAT